MMRLAPLLLLLLLFLPSGVKIPRVKRKVNEKLQWSLLVARVTVVEQDRVKALNGDRNALEKKAGLSVVSWNRRYLAAQLRKESDRWLIQRAKCLLRSIETGDLSVLKDRIWLSSDQPLTLCAGCYRWTMFMMLLWHGY